MFLIWFETVLEKLHIILWSKATAKMRKLSCLAAEVNKIRLFLVYRTAWFQLRRGPSWHPPPAVVRPFVCQSVEKMYMWQIGASTNPKVRTLWKMILTDSYQNYVQTWFPNSYWYEMSRSASEVCRDSASRPRSDVQNAKNVKFGSPHLRFITCYDATSSC